TSYVVAEPYSTADFLHGPVAMVERGFPALVIDPSSPLSAAMGEAMTMLEKKGARRIAISDRDDVLARADVALRMPVTPEWLSPIVAVVPGQLLALALCAAKGLDPDAPRGLRKVT